MEKGKKQKQAYGKLMSSAQPALPEGKTLPVHELPAVRKRERKEYRKRAPMLRRLGGSALDTMAGVTMIASNPQMYGRSTEANRESMRTGKGLSRLGRLAARRWVRSGEKRDKQRGEAREVTVAKFREEHPNVALQEADLHKKWEREEAERQREEAFSSVVTRSRNATEYFRRRIGSSFSKYIPGRETGFNGSYLDLAKTTMGNALTHQRKDGAIPLLGYGIEKERFEAKEAAGTPLSDIKGSDVGGASTALWKLGFVELEERMVRYAGGKFNPDIEWGQTEDRSGVTADLAFDPENELHRMLVPESSEFSNPRIQVEMSNDTDTPYMDLRVVEAVAPIAVAA
jgi:hypothetical protein